MNNLKIIESFRSFNESKFEKSSKYKYDYIIQDIEDILLDLKDVDIRYEVSQYIDDTVFDIKVSILTINSKEDKSIVEHTIFRLSDYLEKYGLRLSSIEMEQEIDNELHRHSLFDLDEMIDLELTSGTLGIDIYFNEVNK